MKTREELLEAGIGSLHDVCCYFVNQPNEDDGGNNAISLLGTVLKKIGKSEQSKRAMLAICISILNEQFEVSGRLWHISPEGIAKYEYIGDGMPRVIMAAAIKG